MKIFDVIKKPLVTEKSTLLKETQNTYVFKVDPRATKPMIKKSVEQLFKVKVDSVRTVMNTGRYKRVGKTTGRTKNWKKAFVSLREGAIQVFEGV